MIKIVFGDLTIGVPLCWPMDVMGLVIVAAIWYLAAVDEAL